MENEKSFKVKITIGDAAVEVEGDVDGVTQIVESLKSVLQAQRFPSTTIPIPNYEPTSELNGTELPTQSTNSSNSVEDIRTFFNQKKPKNNPEAAAAVAYFLQHIEKSSDTLNAKKLEDEYRKADWPLPRAISQVLIDTKHAGYLDAAGAGNYRLNSVGYNLVHHALNGEREVVKRKSPKKKTAKKVVKKKR